RAQAIGIWAAVASMGALSGPLLGGVLVNAFGWRSIFLINLPIGILGFLLTFGCVAPSTPQGGRSLDLPGQVAGILALGTLTFALIEGNSALPHGKSSFVRFKPSFPPTLNESLLQGRNVAHRLWSGRSTWHSLESKRKMFHEANRREESVASAHQSPAARLQRRGAWNSH